MAKLFDGETFGNQVVEVVRGYLDSVLAPMQKELEELRQLVKSLPAPAEPTVYVLEEDRVREIAQHVVKEAEVDHTQTIADAVASAIPDVSKMVADAVAAIPLPVDGKSVTVEDVTPLIQETVAEAIKSVEMPDISVAIRDQLGELVPVTVDRAVEALPKPQDGKSVTIEEVRPILQEMVDAINIPMPAAVHGKDGKDGLDVKDMFRAEGGHLIAVLSDGTTRDLGPFVGKDGRDGFSLDSFNASLMEDGRTVLMSFEQGDQSFKAELSIPAMIYRDYFEAGKEYVKGDTVTYGGNLWHCNVEKSSNIPGRENSDWRLCAKKGRDGRDLVPKDKKATTSVPVGELT